MRCETGEREGELRLQTLALSASLADKDKQIEEINQSKKTFKMHKKVLKDEVLRLRKEVNEWEMRAQNKSVALKNLADFFNNQTLARLRQMNPELLVPEKE